MSSFLPEESLPGDPKAPAENSRDSSRNQKSFQDSEIERLRQMLFAREIALLEEVVRNQGAKDFNTERVSEVLAESIILRAGKDGQLNIALEPVVDNILKSSLSRRKNDFVNMLFPLMGPVIRKSISETFLSMLGNFSQSLEVAFSWRGLRWRFQAWRSGRPFNEIVLLHTVLYRVEQVFFIHSETGLPLSHVVNEEVAAQDVDMVSGMLTAIQDFVRDSFSEDEHSHLHSLQMGDLTLIIEKNNLAYVACVVRGSPPANFRNMLQESLDLMMVEYAEPLRNFSGDTAPFLTAVRYLQPLLLSRYAEEEKKIPFWAKAVPILCLLALLLGGSYLYYEKFTRNRLLEKAVLSLNGHPGIIITNVIEHKDAPWEVLAFKDALARHPENILQEKGFSPDLLDLNTVPFISYDSAIILRRVHNAVSPPESVKMELREDGTLVFSGEASMSWMVHSRDAAMALPGVKRVDVTRLRDPLIEEVLDLVKAINGASIEFPLGKDFPVGENLARLEETVDHLVQLEKIARKSDLILSLTVYGHADTIGSEKRNYEISLARSKTIAAMLYAKGTSIPISLYGMGSKFHKENSQKDNGNPYAGDQSSRRIELRVSLARAVSADSLFGENQ